MVISRVSMSVWAGTRDVARARSYIVEIAPTAFAGGKPSGTVDTYGDLGLATPPFLSQSIAYRKIMLGPHGSPISTHAALGETGDVMGQGFCFGSRVA
jgi:hypothetical protein